jgi:hypothetical protein
MDRRVEHMEKEYQRKMPIICKRAVDGKPFKFGVELQKLVGLEG